MVVTAEDVKVSSSSDGSDNKMVPTAVRAACISAHLYLRISGVDLTFS